MNFVTVLFAFIVATHLAANRNSWLQLSGLTALYTIFSAVSIAGCLQDVDLVYKLVGNFYATYPEEALLYFPVDGVNYRGVVIGVLAAAWFVSVVNAVYWKKVT